MNYEEETIKKEHIYDGKIIKLDCLTVSLPNGGKSTRDVVTHPGASVVIPVNEKGEIFMVRQYRKPIEKVLLELPAGKLDKGEEPEACARRELKEETGLTARSFKYITSIYSTPGFSDEILHIFMATGLEAGEACSDEDEYITCEKYKLEELIDMILNRQITDAKTIVGILLAEKQFTLHKF